MEQAVTWYDESRKSGDLLSIGKLLHMVQDSYSGSHVVRSKFSGGVVNFQSYDKQDADEHAIADKIPDKSTWKDVPGASKALEASTKILELYKSGATSGQLTMYLRKEVYYFANGNIGRSNQDAYAGGTAGAYAK